MYNNTLFELKSPKKGLINIKNNDQKCFLWCHVRHINPVKIHPEGIAREDKKLANVFNYDRIGFPVGERDFNKIETKNNICMNVFCYGNRLAFPIYISDQEYKKFNGSVACIWWKQVTLCVYQIFWQIYVSQNKE